MCKYILENINVILLQVISAVKSFDRGKAANIIHTLFLKYFLLARN